MTTDAKNMIGVMLGLAFILYFLVGLGVWVGFGMGVFYEREHPQQFRPTERKK